MPRPPEVPSPSEDNETSLFRRLEGEIHPEIPLEDQRAFLRLARCSLNNALQSLGTYQRVTEAIADSAILSDTLIEYDFRRYPNDVIAAHVTYRSTSSPTVPTHKEVILSYRNETSEPCVARNFTIDDVAALHEYFDHIDAARLGNLLPDVDTNLRLPDHEN